MPKKITSLGEQLKGIIARCEGVVRNVVSGCAELPNLNRRRQEGFAKLSATIQKMKQAGAQGDSTADFQHDPAVVAIIRDIVEAEFRFANVIAELGMISHRITPIGNELNTLIAKTQDLVRGGVPELGNVLSAARKLKEALGTLIDQSEPPLSRDDLVFH